MKIKMIIIQMKIHNSESHKNSYSNGIMWMSDDQFWTQIIYPFFILWSDAIESLHTVNQQRNNAYNYDYISNRVNHTMGYLPRLAIASVFAAHIAMTIPYESSKKIVCPWY